MQARELLDRLIAARGETYAQLSSVLGRNAAYVQQFVKRGTPRTLSRGEAHLLAQHFDVPPNFLHAAEKCPDYGPALLAAVKIRGALAACERLGLHLAASHIQHALDIVQVEVATRSESGTQRGSDIAAA